MPDLSLPLPDVVDRLGDLATVPVSDADLPVALVEAPIEKSVPLSTDRVGFVVKGAVAIHLFNAREDLSKHPDPLFARPGETDSNEADESEDEDDAMALGPQLTYRDDAAWLKYATRASTKITASTDGDVRGVGFGASVDGENAVAFADYRVHDLDTPVADAVTSDVASARFAVVAEHVRALAPDDALSIRSDGSLQLQLELSWSDVVSSAIGVLGRLSDRLDVVRVNVDARASLSVDVSVEDAFTLVFTRPEPGRLRLAVRKSASRRVDLAAGAKVEVAIQDEGALGDLVDDTLAGLLDAPMDRVESLLDATPDALSGAQDKLLDALLDRLGLEPGDDAIDRLERTVTALRTQVTDRIREAVSAKVSLGVSYEYARVDATTSLLQATFDDDRLDALHAPAVRGDLAPILERTTGDDPPVTLERFLRQRTTRVSKSWGFGLSLGKWLSFGGSDFRDETWTETQRAEGRVHLAFSGVRGYKKDARRDETWRGELAATMRAPHRAENATADAFDYGLSVLYEYRGAEDPVLRRVIDQACIWDALPVADRDAEFDRLKALVGNASDVTSTCTVHVRGTAFLPILTRIAEKDVDAMAAALAEAMPWDADFEALRQDPQRRRHVFAPLWKSHLRGRLRGRQRITNTAAHHLDASGFGNALFLAEQKAKPGTFSATVLANPSLRNQWLDLVDGANRLKNAFFQRRSHTDIETAYHELRRTWTQSLNVRGLGTYLADLAAENAPSADVQQSVTVAYTADGAERVYVVGSGRLPDPA